ncbi:MAG: VapE family protein, partial [Azospirillaceae bacterium]
RLIVEISELAAMKRADTEAIKAFISRREEHFRPAYARCEITYRRQCVFAGTSNRSDFLRDATGNRRFWPVAVTRFDLAALRRDRDQIWAEAVSRYRNGERWWLSRETEAVARKEQEARFAEDVWTASISQWLDRRNSDRVFVADILTGALEIEAARHDKAAQLRVRDILSNLGWRSGKRTKRGVPWFPPE